MSSNISDPLPKRSDNPGEKVRKKSGNLDDIKKALVATNDKFFKEGNTYMVDKKRKTEHNVLKEAITFKISSKKKIDTVNKTDKSQPSNKTVDTPRRDKT